MKNLSELLTHERNLHAELETVRRQIAKHLKDGDSNESPLFLLEKTPTRIYIYKADGTLLYNFLRADVDLSISAVTAEKRREITSNAGKAVKSRKGRTPIYTSDDERKEAKREAVRKYRAKQKPD